MAQGGESTAHWRLKQAALEWARTQRYAVRACEIRLPHSAYRADVVAYRPEKLVMDGEPTIGQTSVFECKCSRPDFLRDAQSAAPSMERLHQLRQRRERIESLLGIHYPSLRSGDSLFPEYERVDVGQMEHRTWKRVSREIRLMENRVHGKTKFEKLIRYRCANLFYFVTVEGLIAPHEIPAAWGVLCVDPETMDSPLDTPAPSLRLVRKPQFIEAGSATRLDLVQRIASSATRRVNRSLGLEGGGGEEDSGLEAAFIEETLRDPS